MHRDQLTVSLEAVRTLISSQFPEWADEPITPVAGSGTVNAIFRIGACFGARFPLRAGDPGEVEVWLRAEADATAELARVAPVPVPSVVAIGAPGAGYPLPWSVQTWLSGEVATPSGLAASDHFARDLAALLRALRTAPTEGRRFSSGGRGGDLTGQDEWMEICFRESQALLDVGRIRSLWARLRTLPSAGADVMSHGDLIPANLLVDGARLVGLLDGGGFAPADPALDLVAGWHLLDADARAIFRAALGCDALEWGRGAAWALAQAMGLVWYYRETNPTMAELGRSTLTRLLAAPEL
ncbi:phosphotransferase [Herbiconiux sp. P17]|uniref:phosphotransferase n=1 Tax=Herbiconiux wuyangfengii TaxID=3342794 RepID=UPI0035B74D52